MCGTKSSANSDSLTSSFPIWLHLFVFLVWWLWLVLNNAMLCKICKSAHPCLAPEFRGNDFSFSVLSMMLALGLSYTAFIMLIYVPSMPKFWRVFIINGCWILSKVFSASIEMIIWFSFFNLLMWYIRLIDLWISNHPCITGLNPTWSWCMILLIYCWIWFANILLRILAFMFTSDIGLYLCVCVCDIFIQF